MRNGDRIFACQRYQRRLPARRHTGQQAGFTYIGLLIMVAIIGIFLATAGTVWHVAAQREKESQLLFIGEQIRTAIGSFYNAKLSPVHQFPQSLAELLRDPRTPGVERYLRKLYPDPITGMTEWGLVKDKDDRIMGVFSLSEEHPIKLAGFSVDNKDFEGKEKYTQWMFVYHPKAARGLSAAKPST